ncbi:MAG: hypothetical protein JNM56_22320 [Planctomycetia bacterium]|nr:hypothetical protein [Planctomycetia bacterium]
MDRTNLVDRQLGRVNRRLFLQVFLNRLVWCWTAALVLALVWFLLQPFLFPKAEEWVRWSVAGGLLALASLVTGVLAALAAPSRVTAALELDDRFGLKERVTTSMLLTPDQQVTPAGKALLDDVNQRIGTLNISQGFPVRFSWTASLVPACALILALVALFYEPPQTVATPNPLDELKAAPVNVAEINQKMNQLRKKSRERAPDEPEPSEEIKRIEAELDKIASRPRENREQLKQRLKEMQNLEDEIKDRQQKMMDKSRSMQQQLQQLDQQAQKNKEGSPTKDLEKALGEGDLAKAKEEVDKLAEKMRNNELSAKEKEKLKEQLGDLQNKLERLARNKDKEDELKKLARDGKLTEEALQRELDRLKQNNENLQDLADLADKLGECKKCLENGDSEAAMQQLKGAADKLKDLDLNDKELQDLNEQLDKLRDAKEAASKGDKKGDKDGKGKGDGDGEGEGEGKDGEGNGKGGQNGKGNGKGYSGPNDGGIGEGRRDLGKDGKTNSYESKQKIDPNWKAKKIFDGFAPGENFKSKSSAEIAGEVKQASQEAPEAIEQQRIPKAARDIAKGYFKQLGGQDDKPMKVPEKK